MTPQEDREMDTVSGSDEFVDVPSVIESSGFPSLNDSIHDSHTPSANALNTSHGSLESIDLNNSIPALAPNPKHKNEVYSVSEAVLSDIGPSHKSVTESANAAMRANALKYRPSASSPLSEHAKRTPSRPCNTQLCAASRRADTEYNKIQKIWDDISVGHPTDEKAQLARAIQLNLDAQVELWRTVWSDPLLERTPQLFEQVYNMSQKLVSQKESLSENLHRVESRVTQAKEFQRKFGAAGHGFAPLPDEVYTKAGGLVRYPFLRQYYNEDATCMYRERGERTTTWSELFYDLGFAIAINRLGVLFEGDVTLVHLLRLMVLFVLVWRTWMRTQNHLNLYDTNDLVVKIYVLSQIWSLVGITLWATVHLDDCTGVALSIIFSILSTVLIRAYTMYHDSILRKANFWWNVSDIVCVCFLIGAAVATPTVLHPAWFLLLAIVSDQVGIYLFSAYHSPVAYNEEHMAERFGLFQVLVFAERLVGLMIDGYGASTGDVFGVIFGGASTVGMQIIYFDVIHASDRLKRHAMRVSRLRGSLWYLFHVPLAGATVLAGIGSKLMLDWHHQQESIHRWVFCAAEFASLLVLTLIHLLHHHKDNTRISNYKMCAVRFFVGFMILMLPMFGASLAGHTYVIISGTFVAALSILDWWGAIEQDEEE